MDRSSPFGGPGRLLQVAVAVLSQLVVSQSRRGCAASGISAIRY